MKLHTQILLGMAVGAAAGAAIGPRSDLLDHDLYLTTGAGASLLADPAAPDSSLPVPPKARLRLHVEETRSERVRDATGAEVEVPTLVRVSFPWSKDLALRDKGGALADRLGVEVGDQAEAWLRIDRTPVDSGGFVLSHQPVASIGVTVLDWLRPIGLIFLKLIKMVIVPLVFCSLLVGVAQLGDVRRLGRMGGRTLVLFMATTACAVTIGVLAAQIIRPGRFVDDEDRAALTAQYSGDAAGKVDAAAEAPSAIDNIVDIVPENPLGAMTSGNMLQIIFFALFLGVALTMMGGDRARPVIEVCDGIQEAMVVVINVVMRTAPIGVAALMAEVVGTSGWSVLQALLVYSLTVLAGLAVHLVVVYGSVVRFLARLRFRDFLRAARPAQLIGFSTSSSSATMPVTLECAEKGMGVPRPVASFVIPLGATVNMDGTALYQGVAAVFIAQVFGIDLSLGAQLGIVLSATLASIGAAGVPGAGMVTLAMVLIASGIPTVGVALILGVDRILDMCRTAVNLTGDLAVTSAVAVAEGATLAPVARPVEVDPG